MKRKTNTFGSFLSSIKSFSPPTEDTFNLEDQIILHLSSADTPSSFTDLLRHLDVSRTQLANALSILESAGFVTIEENQINLTPKGKMAAS